MGKTYAVYKITCLTTKKSYIGQTTNIARRWKEHIDSARTLATPLYNDIRLYGIENITFQILETNISEQNIDAREQYWISKYDSMNNGYNIEPGGKNISTKSTLTQNDVNDIITLILTKEPFESIAKKYFVDRSTISDINNGDTWFNENLSYPLIITPYRRKHFTKDQVAQIESMLSNGYTTVEIAKKFETSVTTICKINNGDIYKDRNKTYPLSKARTTTKHLSPEKTLEIAQYLQTTNFTYTKIERLCQVSRKTVSNINQGKSYTEYLSNNGFKDFPIRS